MINSRLSEDGDSKEVVRSVTAMFFHNGKLLMLLRDDKPGVVNPNVWGIIGGGIDGNETPLEAIKRESKEEISVAPSGLIYMGKSSREKYRFFAYLTDIDKHQISLGDEGQGLRFFEIDLLSTIKTTPKMKEWIDKYLDQIRYLSTTPNLKPNSIWGLL